MLLRPEPLHPRGRVGSTPGAAADPHAPGSPIRKSEGVAKPSIPCEQQLLAQIHRMSSNSPPKRIVCFPLVQESWSPKPTVVWCCALSFTPNPEKNDPPNPMFNSGGMGVVPPKRPCPAGTQETGEFAGIDPQVGHIVSA